MRILMPAFSKLYTGQVVYEVSPGLFHQPENSWKGNVRTSNNCRTLTYSAFKEQHIWASGWRLAYSSLLAWASTRYDRQLVTRLQSLCCLRSLDLDCEMGYSMPYNINACSRVYTLVIEIIETPHTHVRNLVEIIRSVNVEFACTFRICEVFLEFLKKTNSQKQNVIREPDWGFWSQSRC